MCFNYNYYFKTVQAWICSICFVTGWSYYSSNKANVNSQFLGILLKITGIAFLTEFAVSICKDSGEAAIATKVDLAGKILIIAISIPIISSLLESIIKILP